MLSTECPSTKGATKMPYQKDTEDKSHSVYSHALPSLQIDINEDMNTDELNRGDSNAKNGTLASLTKKKPNQNESQYFHQHQILRLFIVCMKP